MVSTSGTFTFFPSTADLIMVAFGRIGVRRTAITTEHMQDAQRESNLWLSSISNQGPNLWTVDLQVIPLIQGVTNYTIPPETVMILDAYIETTPSGSSPIDTTITALNRSDYSMISNKEQQGMPTSYWYDREISQSVNIWPVPDGAGPYFLNYYRYRQVQDANLAGGQNIELPYLFLDAYVAAMSYRLARIYAPSLESMRKQDAAEAWSIASTQNIESAPMNIAPALSSYYR